MAHAQIQLKPYSGLEKESFREFEHLLRSYLAVAVIPGAQQANFLQLHLRDAALRFFQTLPDATRIDVDLSLAALRDRFCNPQLQELHVLTLENLKFDSKTDTPENFLVTLQTKALKAYPDPILIPVAPIDAAAPDAAVEQTRFDTETARNAEQLRSAQESRSNQIRRQFIKNMPGWLRAKLLEQPETTPVEDLCTFARKQLTIHNLCKIDDSPMDAFSEVGPTVTDTLVTALTKLSTVQEAMDNRLNEISKKFEERNTALTNQLENVQKAQNQNASTNSYSQSNRGSSGNFRGQNSNQRGFRGGYRGRYQGNSDRGYLGNRSNFNRPPWGQRPRYQSQRPNFQNFNNQSWQNNPSNFGAPSFPAPSVDANQSTFEVFTPDPNYMPFTQQSSTTCYKCGYPNHLAINCTLAGPPPRRGAQMPFNQHPKN